MYISVVIPMHNNEKTIGRALDSVIHQSVKPDQIIVVDDCSTDNGVEIVQQYTEEDGIVELICCKENRGAQSARNIGIKAASDTPDTWIAFLDADDEWLENKLELQIEALKDFSQCDLIFGDCYQIREGIENYRTCGTEHIYTPKNFISAIVLFQTMLVRKSCLEEINYLDNYVPCYQEWDTALRLIPGRIFLYINKPLFKYYIDGGEHISTKVKSVDGFRYVVLKNRNVFSEVLQVDVFFLYLSGLIDRESSSIERVVYKMLLILYRLCPLRKIKKRVALYWMGVKWKGYGNNKKN